MKINESAITKFLAEKVMEWHVEVRNFLYFWIDKNNEIVMNLAQFDPIHNMAHVFKAREAFGDKVVAVFKESQWEAGRLHDIFEGSFRDTDFLNVEPSDFCIAAVRALGTPEEIEECGL